MTSPHDKLLYQVSGAISRIFDLSFLKTAGYGSNPRNIEDTLEIDMLGQKGNILYVFEVKTNENDTSEAITQLKNRHLGLNLNKDNIVNKQKQLPHYDYIKLFIVTPKEGEDRSLSPRASSPFLPVFAVC